MRGTIGHRGTETQRRFRSICLRYWLAAGGGRLEWDILWQLCGEMKREPVMRFLRRLCLLVILVIVSTSQAQGDYPACWETELTTSLVSLPFYRSYYSQLEAVETADDLVEFAESHLPSRDRAWRINERCAESVELIWRTQQELSLRAAYKAVVFGLLAKVDAEPAALEEYNPLRAIQAEPWYPGLFMDLGRQAPGPDRQRRAALRAFAGGGRAAGLQRRAHLAGLAPLRPDYRRIIDDSEAVASIDDLLALAARQIDMARAVGVPTRGASG